MANRFTHFVILAEMRTGSNFLEENINAFSGLKCWGEAYNPHFIGKSKKKEMCGVSMEAREQDPFTLLDAMIAQTTGLAGFRFFHDHDPRVLERVLGDPNCAKVILTRNPLESYVSRKIASATGQWRLGDMKDAKTAQIDFEKAEFEGMLGEVKGFQIHLQRALQTSGQSAFYINYEDIQDIEVINGLARYLGVDERKDATSKKTKVQNPSSLQDKVRNYDDMVRDLSSVDHFNLSNTPNFEPRRAPAVPGYIAALATKLLYQPIQGGPNQSIEAWLASIDGGGELLSGFSQKTLRQWKRQNKGHKSFTVISHPVVRLHRVFCERIVSVGEGSYGEIRAFLRKTYNLDVPEGEVDGSYTLERHSAGFIQFADFVRGNLNGQTSVRVDGAWASQSEVLRGFANFAQPDLVLREEALERDLARLASDAGCKNAVEFTKPQDDSPFALKDVYNNDVEHAVKAAYQRDYMIFGIRPYSKL